MTAIAFDPAFIEHVSSALPTEMTDMLLEEAERALKKNINAIQDGATEARFMASARAMQVVGFLLDTLNFEDGGDVALNQDKIYRIAMACITRINPFKDAKAAYAAINVLQPQAQAWRELAQQEHLLGSMPAITTAPHVAANMIGPMPMHSS